MSQSPPASGDQAQAELPPSPPSQSPADAQDIRAEHTSLMRDFVFEALAPVENDSAAARHCLANDDEGTRYHLMRVVECVKAPASTSRELEAHVNGQ
jgi:hypothetical protein